jgi:hypothetical protein
MKTNLKLAALLSVATLLSACSGAEPTASGARVLDNNTSYAKSPLTLVTQSNIVIKMNYAIDYHNHSSNKPSHIWYIAPLQFEVSGIAPTSRARVVFTNFVTGKSGCGMSAGSETSSYFVDLKPNGETMVGNLLDDGFFVGLDGKNYSTSYNLPVTRSEPYCTSYQSTKQLVALVVDGVWQTAREIVRDGKRQTLSGTSNDFELHLESY